MSGGHVPGSGECREIFEKLSEYMDGELDDSLCSMFDKHIGDCPPCVAFLESLRRTVDLMGRLPRPRLSEAQKREISEAYRRLKGKPGS